MKKILSIGIIFCLASFASLAQKSKLKEAKNYSKDPYLQYDKAKDAIDLAATDDVTKGMEETWYYRGIIYNALYKSEKYGSLCNHCLETAYESFVKANEINPKNEWADEIKALRIPILLNQVFGRGVDEFKDKKYADALISFEFTQKMSPGDTSAILNSAYAADRAGNLDKARQYYERLINMKYYDDKIFLSLSNICKMQKDTTRALLVLQDARKIYPDTLSLMLSEINILLATGRNREASESLDKATKRDPNNQNLFMALGSTYDNLANPKDETGKDLPKPINYSDYMIKAEQAYLRGLQINPDNYEINYNLGAMYFNQAAEMANAANNIKSNDEFTKAKEKYEKKFRDSEPYLERAMASNPRTTGEDKAIYKGTLSSLKQIYVRTSETDKYNHVKELYDSLNY